MDWRALLPVVTSRLDFWNDSPNRMPWFSEIGIAHVETRADRFATRSPMTPRRTASGRGNSRCR